MNDKSDQFIQQCIKNWAAQQQAPTEIRSRVLFAASPLCLKVINGSQFTRNTKKSQTRLASYRFQINKRTLGQGRTQMWAWNIFTMTAPRFIA